MAVMAVKAHRICLPGVALLARPALLVLPALVLVRIRQAWQENKALFALRSGWPAALA
jgi:hypothetical protein